MTKSGALTAAISVAAMVAVGGCKDDAPPMTQTQMEAIRHPKASPNYVPPTEEQRARIGQAMDAFNEKHKNDKVEFVK